MALSSHRLLLISSALFVLTGCPEDDQDNRERLEEIADQVIEDPEDARADIEAACECWEAYGYMSQQGCVDLSLSVLTLNDRDCYLDALLIDPDASVEYFDCFQPFADSLTSCLNEAQQTCDPEAIAACSEQEAPECPDLPEEVETALGNCRIE
jgi:hypothetical protein